MGHQGKDQHRDTRQISFADSAARAASGSSEVIEIGDRGVLRLRLVVTATSGTPTLDVVIKTRKDENDSWRTAATLPQLTAASTAIAVFMIDREVQADWTIGGGTPSLTFSLDGEAV